MKRNGIPYWRNHEFEVEELVLLWMAEEFIQPVALQTLKLTNCPQLRDLPKDMKNLANLRHLHFDVKGQLKWRKLRSGLDPQLLDHKKNEQAEVLVNLQPYENVKELVIQNYCGVIYPDWLSQPWHKFTSIHLQGLKYCDNLPSLGQLPFLKYFAISDLPSLKYVDHNFYGTCNAAMFTLLESFQLHDMSALLHWRNVSNDAMPCLNTFTIHGCPNLISLPHKLLSLLPYSSVSNCGSLQAVP
ncbi:UNVERIFIED_CONTAM: hypothetical protein Sangu_0784000 [Sesamum angustifolium]|uniref:R13L1/DRL21-like LRR repeat region domain-containing protein n=1 Tax=Sesamum angustifolium TaxID=2727405 RepID=A0AAW2PV63_9LAMI